MLKTALVLGATGLVGKTLVEQLCQDHRYQTVTCLVRKPLSLDFFCASADSADKVQPIVAQPGQVGETTTTHLVQ